MATKDYTADEELINHGFAEDGRDAARLAFTAGVDMSMQSGLQLGVYNNKTSRTRWWQLKDFLEFSPLTLGKMNPI